MVGSISRKLLTELGIRTEDAECKLMGDKCIFVIFVLIIKSCVGKSNIHKIEMVQRRAARWTLCRFSSYDSVSDMLGDLGWRSLEDRRTDSRLYLFYKIVHGLVAVPLPPYVVHTQVFTKHSASHPQAFRQIHTVADYYKYSFFPLAIVQWNRLPPSIALLPDIDSFRLAVSSLTHSKL